MRKLVLFFAAAAITSAAWSAETSLNLSALDDANSTTTTTSQPAAAPNTSCHESDPRLASLGKVIKNIQAGKPPAKPVRITSGQLLNFNPKVLAMLGDNYVVVAPDCSVVAVVGGELIRSVAVDFGTLANEIATAITDGDKDRLSYLASSFQAAAIDPVQGLSLATVAPYSKAVQEKIAKVFKVTMRADDGGAGDVKYLALPDLFARLGGQLTQPFTLNQDHDDITYTIDGKQVTSSVLTKIDDDDAKAALRNMGYVVR